MATAESTPGRLTVLSGPAGVGKSTVVELLRRRHPEVWHSVSVTTRPPRPSEREGVDRFFIDDAAFDQLVTDGRLLEHATYAGHRYGTPRQPVEERLGAGALVLLEIEVDGARQIRQAMPDARLVFLAPPSWDELERRLRGRGTETPEIIERRLDRARAELAAQPEFDHTLINTDVGEITELLVGLMSGS